MIAAFLLAAALAGPPVDAAERAFAARAQREGQWRAFLATAEPDALMLAPGLVRAHDLLPTLPEPRRPVMWWPARTVTSCDGTLALSTGPWRADGGRAAGRFFTLWRRQRDGGWKWVFDGGHDDAAGTPAGERVTAHRAACRKPAARPQSQQAAGGASRDGTLRWALTTTGAKDKYRLLVEVSGGARWETAAEVVVG